MLSPTEFLKATTPYRDVIALVLDREASTESDLVVSQMPVNRLLQWFALPTAAVDSVKDIGIDFTLGVPKHVVLVRLKREFKSLEALIFAGSKQGHPCHCGHSASLPTRQATNERSAVDLLDQKLFVFPDDFNVGDCTLKGGFSLTVRSNGTAVFRGEVKSSDTNDRFSLILGFLDSGHIGLPGPIGFDFDMPGNLCTDRFCYWEQGKTYDAALFPKIAFVGGTGQC